MANASCDMRVLPIEADGKGAEGCDWKTAMPAAEIGSAIKQTIQATAAILLKELSIKSTHSTAGVEVEE
jgi:hypothetical protein